MLVPPYLQRWTLLNVVRLLTITACALVLGACIDLLHWDLAAYRYSKADSATGYHTGTDIPTTFLGVFWTTLHYTYLVTVLFIVLVSELSLPVPTLHRFFKNFLPFLGPNWGTGFMGALLVLLASDTLSRNPQRRFALASSWTLAVTGVVNIVAGLVWRAKGKMLRSPGAWKHSVAQRMEQLADVKARAEVLREKVDFLPLHVEGDKLISDRVSRTLWQRLRSRFGGRDPGPSSGHKQSPGVASDALATGTTVAAPPITVMPAMPAMPAQAAVYGGHGIVALPAAVPYVQSVHRGQEVPPSRPSHVSAPVSLQASSRRQPGTETDSGDSSFRSTHRTSSSAASSYSSIISSHDDRQPSRGRAALLEALSQQCKQSSSSELLLPVTATTTIAKTVQFKTSSITQSECPSVSSMYTDHGRVSLILPAFDSRDSEQVVKKRLPNDFDHVQRLLGVEYPAVDEPQLSPSVVASYKAAMLEAEAKARCQKLKKSLYLGSDKWHADRRKDAAQLDNSPSPAPATTPQSRPYNFL